MTSHFDRRISRHWIWAYIVLLIVIGWIYFGWLGVILAAAIEYAVYVGWKRWGKP